MLAAFYGEEGGGGGVSGNTSKNDSGLILALRVLFLFVPSISFFASAQP